ncbi:MAG: 1,4-alpha-glucan branching protein GlgB [Myxococcaceae bacterium]
MTLHRASVAEDELRAIIELRHADPHHVLGAHPIASGVVVRAFRPNAKAIDVRLSDGKRVSAKQPLPGLFEAQLPGSLLPLAYTLCVAYPNGVFVELDDPYRHLPTLGEQDLYFAGEGRDERLWQHFGAHPKTHGGVAGVAFAVWAPTARSVSVVGDFNGWDGRIHTMRCMGNGFWELFVPGVREGTRYKFEIRPSAGGPPLLKADPLAFRAEHPPNTASVVHELSRYSWNDAQWMAARGKHQHPDRPLSIYEVHLPSWRRIVEEGHRPLTYREAAPLLVEHCTTLGFTHVELLPITEHPYGPSWGYQVTGYFAPTARHGTPDDFRFFVDHLHQNGIGLILDWVPAHFPRDAHGLARFDGSAVYEHADPREGEHPDWGTLVFNLGRHEVRNFLLASALFWLEEYHVDGLRVDAVASMLYRDYSRKPGEWVPNRWGGRENEEAIRFFQELNSVVGLRYPGVWMIAEESTAWPKVSAPTHEGGLGFHYKWNMGWMHDTLNYFSKDPVYRRHHHNELTFGLLYAFSERFILPLSHDEVVHGKGSLYGRMPGDGWQKRANLRALFAWMWAHPGKKLLFMGGEFGQHGEWGHDRSLDWHLMRDPGHAALAHLVSRLNHFYRSTPALFEHDDSHHGFQWLQADSADMNVYAFVRRAKDGSPLVCIANLSPEVRPDYRVGVPQAGPWREMLNTDASVFGGSNVAHERDVMATVSPWNHQPASALLRLPPLAVVWLQPA